MDEIRTTRAALDLFCGAGGLSEGLAQSGWDVALALDHDPDSCRTYTLNHNEKSGRQTSVICSGIESFDAVRFRNELNSSRPGVSGITLVAGGPPCQGFSMIGPRNPKDVRNRLFLDYAGAVRFIKPQAFLAENVRGILSFAGGRMPAFLGEVFDGIGYVLSYGILNARDFGVPQDRPRVIFLGLRKDLLKTLGIDRLRLPAPCMPDTLSGSYRDGHRVTVQEAMGDLPLGQEQVAERRIWVTYRHTTRAQGRDYSFPYLRRARTAYQEVMRRHCTEVWDSHTKGISQARMDKIVTMDEGSTLGSPGRNNAWRRLEWNSPAHTLQAHMGKDLKEYIHPSQNRWITVREASRLQSFADDYRFSGSQSAQLRQIGNAVPPHVGWALGHAIAQQLGCHLDREVRLVPTRRIEPQPIGDEILRELLTTLGRMGRATDEELRSILDQVFDRLVLSEEDTKADSASSQE